MEKKDSVRFLAVINTGDFEQFKNKMSNFVSEKFDKFGTKFDFIRPKI